MNKQPQQTSEAGRRGWHAEQQARRKAKACLSCGLCICPGARGQKCITRKENFDLPERWV